MPVKAVIQHRRDSTSNWSTANPILAAGEIGVDLGATAGAVPQFKMGDGVNRWNDLEYKKGTNGIDAPTIVSFNNVENLTTYILASTDKNKLVTLSNTNAISVLIPTDAQVPFEIGTTINLMQASTGQVTVGAVNPQVTTIRTTPGFKFRAQWSNATLYKWKANEWILAGDTTL